VSLRHLVLGAGHLFARGIHQGLGDVGDVLPLQGKVVEQLLNGVIRFENLIAQLLERRQHVLDFPGLNQLMEPRHCQIPAQHENDVEG